MDAWHAAEVEALERGAKQAAEELHHSAVWGVVRQDHERAHARSAERVDEVRLNRLGGILSAHEDAALDSFLSQYPYQCDSLFAVRQWQTRLYDQLGNAVRATRQPPHRRSCCVPRLAGRGCAELYSAAKRSLLRSCGR